jgi:two-component system, sensor histidine kinase and response regulator
MTETLLLIEDELELQQNLKEILEYNGYTVLTFDNGQEAWQKLENRSVDLILCDIMMPVLDGFQFLRLIRSTERFQNTPFIFLSAKARKEDKERGLAEGADDYLTKPISARMLLNAVFGALDKRRDKHIMTSDLKKGEWAENNISKGGESNNPEFNLIRQLDLIKKAAYDKNWEAILEFSESALKYAKIVEKKFDKLSLFRDLKFLKPQKSEVFAVDILLDLIQELGPEKFVFRSRSPQKNSFDRAQLQFILNELLVNAICYRRENLPVEIEWIGGELTVKNLQNGRRAGEPLVIQPFFNSGKSNQASVGLGLGLYLVAEYCKGNQAKFSCEVNAQEEFVVRIQFPQ